jgi:hypothetical protein
MPGRLTQKLATAAMFFSRSVIELLEHLVRH